MMGLVYSGVGRKARSYFNFEFLTGIQQTPSPGLISSDMTGLANIFWGKEG